MTVLTIGQATKAFINEHVEYHRTLCSNAGRAFAEKVKRDDLMVTTVALSACSLDQVKQIAGALLPVTSAIASALLIDNEGN